MSIPKKLVRMANFQLRKLVVSFLNKVGLQQVDWTLWHIFARFSCMLYFVDDPSEADL
jgi:hypothetical protein